MWSTMIRTCVCVFLCACVFDEERLIRDEAQMARTRCQRYLNMLTSSGFTLLLYWLKSCGQLTSQVGSRSTRFIRDNLVGIAKYDFLGKDWG